MCLQCLLHASGLSCCLFSPHSSSARRCTPCSPLIWWLKMYVFFAPHASVPVNDQSNSRARSVTHQSIKNRSAIVSNGGQHFDGSDFCLRSRWCFLYTRAMHYVRTYVHISSIYRLVSALRVETLSHNAACLGETALRVDSLVVFTRCEPTMPFMQPCTLESLLRQIGLIQPYPMTRSAFSIRMHFQYVCIFSWRGLMPLHCQLVVMSACHTYTNLHFSHHVKSDGISVQLMLVFVCWILSLFQLVRVFWTFTSLGIRKTVKSQITYVRTHIVSFY